MLELSRTNKPTRGTIPQLARSHYSVAEGGYVTPPNSASRSTEMNSLPQQRSS